MFYYRTIFSKKQHFLRKLSKKPFLGTQVFFEEKEGVVSGEESECNRLA